MNKVQKFAISTGMTLSGLASAVMPVAAATKITDTNVDPGKGFATDFGGLINGVLSFVMVIAALLVFLYLIWGGIEWITSGGDKGKTESARNKITSAIIGLVVVAASYAILTLALNFLGFTDLNDVFTTRSIQGK
ncbi:MAG: hypothetical protein COU63_03675 [Candidatus Pacebacteria bacterium CG10_big_fil_rev_8_21_14_0_10_36_11]|nr:hypothetical protein [Candidatus Pacearchaeota archaeon]OIP73875.1 MAG: hypothetical protein AUK08_04955 [Candidatus Pacebacteria bacterium CG2_30_36_39]PIR64561.1 MAG: hypothetical protein COU63_03675 [Candidatus Pacebacteria bacterium CG10_big_fil_rev_8_21_14_0_10_36_11]PJC42695.1 MAG: hypothetical protein CO040_03120 [Candidatus Pacebacteria bacterium CG_4_9_14_0_2_um_filter_36_8]